ncbi:MAG: sugar ABC transporter permease [Clostridium sp.]
MRDSKIKNIIKALLLLSPVIIIVTMFSIYPIIKTIDMSFYNKFNYYKFVVYERGFDNYRYIFRDAEFYIAMKNTLIYVCFVMPISIGLSLLIAILINSNIGFKGVFRSIYFLPFVTSTVAISMVFSWIFNSEHGVLNYLLGLIGVNPIKWLTDPKYAMTSLIILSVWKSLGYNIIIFLAGLQNIDVKYSLAAKIDGANSWQRVKNITVPLLSPTIFFISVITLVNCFKVFSEVFALFGKSPGPLNSCLTMVYYIYNKFYNQFQYGTASAAVIILFLIILILNLIQFYIGRKKIEYY